MGYRLANGVSCAFSGGRTIFIDIARSRYFGLPWETDRGFQNLVRGDESALSQASTFSMLVGHEILLEIEGPTNIQPCTLACGQENCSGNGAEVTPLITARCLLAQLSAARLANQVSLMELSNVLDRKREKHRNFITLGVKDHRWSSIIAAFQNTRLFQSKSDRCLANSIALFSIGLSYGIDSKIVFGVNAVPFAAHCWVQQGDIIMGDDVETVSRFTPILAL